MKKNILLFSVFVLSNTGYSQVFDCADYQIIQLQDSIHSGYPHLYFEMTTNSNNGNSGYSDFVFIDQNGDTITSPTHWSMWLPESNNPNLDTTRYLLNFKPGVTSFPSDFDGYLEVKNPNCSIPFNYSTLSTPSVNQELESIRVYPNPSTDKLYISGTSSLKIDLIQMFNMNGELLSMDISLNQYLDISHLPQGLYIIKIYSNQASKAFRIQKG